MTLSQREFRQASNRGAGFNDLLRRRPLTRAERHARKCVICRHPNRQEIEAAFLRWQSPKLIVSEFNLHHPRYIYRHAHATGLYALRRFKLSCALERIIEYASTAKPDARAVLKAIYVCCHIDEHGVWRDSPPAIVTTSVESGESADPAAPNSSALTLEIEPGLTVAASVRGLRRSSNRHFVPRLETPANA